MCLMSVMTQMEFSRPEHSASTQHRLSTKHPEFALSVAVVDTRSLTGMGNHCEGSASVIFIQCLLESRRLRDQISDYEIQQLGISKLLI
jgi:hypothetical protein